MKRKIRKAKRCARCQNRKQSLVAGLINDVWFVIRGIIKLVSWPVHAFSHLLARECKKHPELKVLHNHAFVSVLTGFMLLLIAFSLEHAFKHVFWTCSIETMKAAGVCPIWETISAKLVRV
jgi:hypothetical protein